jgi:hypothetical protein
MLIEIKEVSEKSDAPSSTLTVLFVDTAVKI